jgi:Na+/H+-translocating membrane pyrophosphatase
VLPRLTSLGCEQVAKGTKLDDEEGATGSPDSATCGIIGLLFALFLFYTVSQVSLDSTDESQSSADAQASKDSDEELRLIYEIVQKGAQSFLWAEYQICFIFILAFGTLTFFLTSRVADADGHGQWEWQIGALTTLSFVVGGLTSILSGYIGES